MSPDVFRNVGFKNIVSVLRLEGHLKIIELSYLLQANVSRKSNLNFEKRTC